jgi:hypothetical protein
MKISVNKAISRGSGSWRCSGGLLLSVHHGGEREEGWLLAARGWLPHLQHGSSPTSTRRYFTAPLSPYHMAERKPLHRRIITAPLSPYFTAERRPLHPRVTATCCPQGSSNPVKRSCRLGGSPVSSELAPTSVTQVVPSPAA